RPCASARARRARGRGGRERSRARRRSWSRGRGGARGRSQSLGWAWPLQSTTLASRIPAANAAPTIRIGDGPPFLRFFAFFDFSAPAWGGGDGAGGVGCAAGLSPRARAAIRLGFS